MDPDHILLALFTNEYVDLGDLVYDVREREGKGWEGPGITAWNKAVVDACDYLKLKGLLPVKKVVPGDGVEPSTS